MTIRLRIVFMLGVASTAAIHAVAQTQTDLNAIRGLAPTAALWSTESGRMALASNLAVSVGLQKGTQRQLTLLPLFEQRMQAQKDVFMTRHNLAGLADGLGSTLGSAYQARAHYSTPGDRTAVSEQLTELVDYTEETIFRNAKSAKFLFGNQTADGTVPASEEALDIMNKAKGRADIYGIAYGMLASSPGADVWGNSRPFQVVKDLVQFNGTDYFGAATDNLVNNRGPAMDLTKNPAYPSGHTTFGYAGAILFAVLVPQRYQQLVTRGAEYGNDRILMGSHYATDVIAGRTLALYDLAQLLAENAQYMGQDFGEKVPKIEHFRGQVEMLRPELQKFLEQACGQKIDACAMADTGRFSDLTTDGAFYEETQTYGLSTVYPDRKNKKEDVFKGAKDAGYLLTLAFPNLTLERADDILTQTEGPGGGFLDDGTSPFGIYSRLNLFAAAALAASSE